RKTGMKSRKMRKVAVLLTGSALALSVPVAGSVANSGGVPNGGNGASKPCPHKGSRGKGPKRPAPNGNGRKCGLGKERADLDPRRSRGAEGGTTPCPPRRPGFVLRAGVTGMTRSSRLRPIARYCVGDVGGPSRNTKKTTGEAETNLRGWPRRRAQGER